MIKRLLNNIGQHKSKWNFGLFFISGLVLIFLLMALVNNINSDIEEKNNKIIAGVQHTVKSLQTTHVSVENKMYFLPEAVSTLSNLGIKISFCSVSYLFFAYLVWVIFIGSYRSLLKSCSASIRRHGVK